MFSLYVIAVVYQYHVARKQVKLKMFMLKFNGKELTDQLRGMVEEFIDGVIQSCKFFDQRSVGSKVPI